MDNHAYADDTQLYLQCRCEDTSTAVDTLEHCITDVNQWMSANRLKLNPEKTKLLWYGSRYSLCKLGGCGPTIKLGTDTVEATGHVRLIGVIMSSDLSLEKHVSVVSAACFFHLISISVLLLLFSLPLFALVSYFVLLVCYSAIRLIAASV